MEADHTALDDDELAARSRAGEARALAILYRRHAGAVLAYLERVLGDRLEAEDVLHETFLRLFEGRGRYTGRGRFRAWLFTVAAHLARDRMRQERRRSGLLTATIQHLAPAQPPDPASQAQHADLLRAIESALADLPPTYGITFHLRVREGFSYAEIALMQGDPEGTLRSRVHHALRRIRHKLTEPAPATEPVRHEERLPDE